MNRRRFIKTGVIVMGGMATVTTNQVEAKNIMEDKNMKHKCKITVLRRELFTDLQAKYLSNPEAGKCPYFEDGQEFLLDRPDFFRMLEGKFCAEAWDCISRYVYSALQGGSIMDGWTNDEKMMIACCNDGTRPVIFKIERIDEEV